MKFKDLYIQNFRHIKEQTFEIGNVLTAIAGQNGTGKSTLLGWIAQSCDTKFPNRTLSNTTFKSKYSEIFRFCPEQDYNKAYQVTVNYIDDMLGIDFPLTKEMTTRFSESDERYRVDFDGRGSAINFPVIYLGLKRLIPLATEKVITLQVSELSKTQKTHFARLSKEILYLTRDIIEAESVKSTNKQIFAMKTEDYGHLGNSAGQDNLGQIISAILSFGKLKDELQGNYEGGLLLIDEIDATLYAGSQIKLIEKLFQLGKNLNLQIIFTTHSIEILEYLSKKTGDDTKINFLKWKNKNVFNEVNPNIEYLKNVIKVQTGEEKKIQKIQFICEDKVAELWSRNLINGTDLKNKIEIIKGPFSEGILVTMSISKHPLFKNTNFILDGDCKKDYAKNPPARTAFLPGIEKPEEVIFKFVYSLDDNDEFWNHDENFTHQTCFGNFADKGYKRWFEDKTNQRFFGLNCSKLFTRWKKDNKEESKKFIEDLSKIIK